MKRMIDKMRADFALVTATRIAAGLWDKGDESAAGEAIAKAVAANDRETVLSWARWLAKLALADLFEDAPETVPPVAKRDCRDCQHFAKPGRSEGYCAGRDDLAKVFGKNHPLSALPADGGASCARFAKAA